MYNKMYWFFDLICNCIGVLIIILIGTLGALPVVLIYNYGISVLGFIGIIIYYSIYFGTMYSLFKK